MVHKKKNYGKTDNNNKYYQWVILYIQYTYVWKCEKKQRDNLIKSQ